MAIVLSPSFISMLGFKVHYVHQSSTINFAPSIQTDLNTFQKATTGTGSSFGDLSFWLNGTPVVLDSDILDTPQSKASIL